MEHVGNYFHTTRYKPILNNQNKVLLAYDFDRLWANFIAFEKKNSKIIGKQWLINTEYTLELYFHDLNNWLELISISIYYTIFFNNYRWGSSISNGGHSK